MSRAGRLNPPTALAGEAVEKLRELMVRAQHAGSLRADVAVADVVVMLLANSGVLAATGQTAPDTWRRFAALMVEHATSHVVVVARSGLPSGIVSTRDVAGVLAAAV